MMIQVLFNELSALRGLPPFAFNDEGVAVLSLEHGVLHIQCREEAGDIVLTATLGVVDERVRGYVFAKLLAANYAAVATNGGMLAFNEELDEVVYQYMLKTEGLTADKLGMTIENMLTMSEAWRLHLERLIEESADAIAAAEAAEDEEDCAYVDVTGDEPDSESDGGLAFMPV